MNINSQRYATTATATNDELFRRCEEGWSNGYYSMNGRKAERARAAARELMKRGFDYNDIVANAHAA